MHEKELKNNKKEKNARKLANTRKLAGTRKLVLYIGSLSKGGAERVFVNLAEFFKEQGYEVIMVTQYQKDEEYILPEGIKRILSDITPEETTNSRICNFCRRFYKLRRIWETEQPDIVLSCVGKNNFMVIATTLFTRTKAVVSVVGEAKEEYPDRIMRILANMLFPLAAGIILQTECSRYFFGKRIQKTAVILPNSLNPLFIRPRYEGERETRIVTVGRMDSNKNQKMMLRAFAELAEKYKTYTLTIYGDGELREYLQKLAEELGISNRVFMPGIIPDVADKIEKASLFLLTSYSEGVSNALIEAMALGLPVIATDVPSGGTRELIQHMENGYIIPVGDCKALTEAMDRILSDASLAKHLGENAGKLQERLAPERVNMMWKHYFETL